MINTHGCMLSATLASVDSFDKGKSPVIRLMNNITILIRAVSFVDFESFYTLSIKTK